MCSQENEILSLAFGHYACHVATHFFNIQEASFSYNPNFSTGINHDYLFRESNSQAPSFTPRLIAVDDQECLGFLSKDGDFKDKIDLPPEENVSPTIKEPLWEKNDFLFDFFKEKHRIQSNAGPSTDVLLRSSYNLDDSVVSWSDYLTTEFNEKTIITLPKNTEYYEKYDTFSCFDSGLSLWKSTALKYEVEENIRFFIEECDNLQGFQVLTDGANGYSGISSGCIELLKDEYSKKSILLVPAIFVDLTKSEDVKTKHKNKCDRVYSLASSYSIYSEFGDIIAPISHIYNPWEKTSNVRLFRNINYKHDLMYHTSAILGTSLDLITLPYRLQNQAFSLSSLSSALSVYGRKFLSVGLSTPFPLKRNEGLLPEPEKIGHTVFESLTPMIDLSPEHIDIQSVTSKGLGKNQATYSEMDPSHIKVIETKFKTYLYQLYPRAITEIWPCKPSFRVPRTFPKILNNKFNLTQLDHDFGPLSEYIAIGGLHNSKEMYGMLNNIYQEAKAINKRAIAGFRPRDSDIHHEELFENLKTSTQSYLDSSFL